MDPDYLQDEASKSLFVGSMFLVLATNSVIGVFALAFHGQFMTAIALSVPSSVFCRNAIREMGRASRLYIAANLNRAEQP